MFSFSLTQVDFILTLLLIYRALKFISENQRNHFLSIGPMWSLVTVAGFLWLGNSIAILSSAILTQKDAEVCPSFSTQQKLGKKLHRVSDGTRPEVATHESL
jgi:hypothetical protein